MNTSRIVLVFILATIFLIANWMMDLSNNCQFQKGCYLFNGFWTAEPVKVFHFSWYVGIGTFMIMCFLALFPEKVSWGYFKNKIIEQNQKRALQ